MGSREGQYSDMDGIIMPFLTSLCSDLMKILTWSGYVEMTVDGCDTLSRLDQDIELLG